MSIAKLLIVFVSAFFMFMVSIMTMIHGWGIEPKNWLVLITGYGIMIFVGLLPTLFDDK